METKPFFECTIRTRGHCIYSKPWTYGQTQSLISFKHSAARRAMNTIMQFDAVQTQTLFRSRFINFYGICCTFTARRTQTPWHCFSFLSLSVGCLID